MERGGSNAKWEHAEFTGNRKDRYQGKLNAPTTKAKEAVYPVMITATGDNGGVTEETRDLIVRNADLFPWNLSCPKNGEELGF